MSAPPRTLLLPSGDDGVEMTTAADDSAVEDAFEALLVGRPVPEEAAGLAAFTASVRATATSPGRPNAALAELLATGLLTDQSSPSARTARSAGTSPSRGTRTRNRRRFAMFFPALIAKLLSAGAVAQAATGAGIVLVAFTGAGVVGVLPGPVQDTFTSIVSDETATDEIPVEEPPAEEPPAEEAPVVEEPPAEEVPVEEAPVVEEPVDEAAAAVDAWMTAPIDGSFGDWVSGARHDALLMAAIQQSGHNFGYYVSLRAHNKGLTADDLADEGVDLGELDEDGTVVDGTSEADSSEDGVVETEQATEDSGSHGNGRGNGNRGGNSHGNGHN
jgi:hypothetical protein